MSELRAGSGTSQLDDAHAAGSAAARAAVAGLDGVSPALVIVYSSIRYDLADLLAGVRAVTGDAPLVGASSTGQFSDGEFLPPGSGVAVMALSSGPYQFATAAVTGIRGRAAEAGRELARGALAGAGPDRAPHGALMVLADGLAGDMQGLLTGIYRVTGAPVPVVGGAAAADRRFDATYVFHDGRVLTDAAVAVWIGAQRPLTVVSAHGWHPTGLPMLVTRTDGQIVHEIGGRPAMDVYLEHIRQQDPTADSRGYHSAHSFGLIEPDGSQVVRGAFVAGDGLLRTFTPLPPYCAIQIVSSDLDELLRASERVVDEALGGVPDPAVMLTFSCVARLDLLKERSGEEAARLHKAAAPVSTFGFYTYGEFARTTGVAGYHNATITALAL